MTIRTKRRPDSIRVLVVDDDPYICELVSLYLKKDGFQVLIATDGRECLNILHQESIHLIILDIMIPFINGWEVCKQIRETSEIPILMLSAKGENQDKVEGLTIGADDYVVKPFNPNELVARVHSLIRRSYEFPKPNTNTLFIRIGQLQIDLQSYTVTISQELIDLTPREFKLLVMFAKHPNQVLTRQQLLDQVWGEDYFGDDRVVDVFVKRLRKKLVDEHSEWEIQTIWGTGYKLKVMENNV
ncbi:MAG TPA: response regulator transcription factor [Bacillota bacterium]|nr:response regulator transcription factor [Bacillota bacterium]